MNTSKLSSIKGLGLRILRFTGAIAVIYASMVFYLALTERQIAFPRAITHKEANQAIQGKAQSLSCTLDDGSILQGWQYGSSTAPTLLYFPDTDEDAAQFLAEVGNIDGKTLVAFNYRGSGNNKGTPSAETFEPDAKQILECATQVNGKHPQIILGRGTGAILATAVTKSSKILIDPIYSIADKINGKYRLLYPKFFIRTNVKMQNTGKTIVPSGIIVIRDRKSQDEFTNTVIQNISIDTVIQADGAPLKGKIQTALKIFADKEK